MKKRFALLRRKLKSVREEKLPGRAVIFSVAAGLLTAAFFTGMIYTKQELYDYIYQLDYIQPSFQLMMGDKQLPALSPGERGALLLLFYLFIDMDDKPLIIDQPEENLDNESVYNYLVHFIKEAKQKRQIIIVTHNPNLAVVCDADQIVEMKIDKSYRNKVSFQSGAIENSIINDRIVTILEGTYPAFNNRDCKYSIVEHKL